MTNINFAFERRHADGSWETTATDSYVRDVLTAKPDGQIPSYRLTRHNIVLWRMLTGVDGCVATPLARPGLPDDLSACARAHYDAKIDFVHAEGSFTLAELDAWRPDDARRAFEAPGGHEGRHSGRARRQRLEEFEESLREAARFRETMTLCLADQRLVGDILAGPELETATWTPWPAMTRASAHERLRRRQRAAGLLPIAGDTFRVFLFHMG